MLKYFTKLMVHLVIAMLLFAVGFLLGGFLGSLLGIICLSDNDWFPTGGSIIVSNLFVIVYLSITSED